jgi:protein-tyrosine phosphatase
MARRRFSALNAVAECARSPHLAAAAQSRLPEQAGKDDPGHPGQPTGMFKHILVLCVGNICRSPTAEYLLRRQLAGRDVRVTSAGLGALVGHPIEGHAMELLHEHGMDATQHRARQVDAEMLREADLVLGMERRHLLAAARLAPEASGKLFLLGKWLEFDGVPDPYRKPRQAFEEVYGLIERGVGSWLRYL